MSFIGNLLIRTGILERRKDARVPVRGLDVSYWTGAEHKGARIKDLSPTGIYIVTKERWAPGTDILLTLERKHLLARHSRLRVRLWARSVRFGEDGVGLTFLRDDTDANAWLKAMDMAAALAVQDDAVRLFRAAKALVFLSRVSPSAENQVLKLMTESLSREKCGRVIEIALHAAELLERWDCAIRYDVPPSLTLQVLEDGSKTDDKGSQEFWAGLLATSCLEGSEDAESLSLASVLSKLTPAHLVILTAGCKKAIQAGWKPSLAFSMDIHCTADEMRKITDTRNLVAIKHYLNHLHELGLLGKTARPLGCEQIERANLTPTSLGLKLYIRCSGPPEQSDAFGLTQLKVVV